MTQYFTGRVYECLEEFKLGSTLSFLKQLRILLKFVLLLENKNRVYDKMSFKFRYKTVTFLLSILCNK